MQLPVLSILLLAFTSVITAQSFLPSAAPLITRSPYLNSWADLTSAAPKPNNWPNFWSANHIVGWGGYIRVDDNVYEWMGAAFADGGLKFNLTDGKKKDRATLSDVQITPTRTIYVMTAGPVQFNVTFLSPVEPGDDVLQSFPFGYVFVDVTSSDGTAHQVQVYSDLSGEWLNFANNAPIQWDTSTSPLITHSAQLASRNMLQEAGNMTQDAILYHATKPGNGVTWQTGGHYALRAWFLTQGSLNNTKDTTFRNIQDNFPVFALSHDLGSITSTQSVVYAIGLARNPVVKQASGSGSFDLPPYWSTKYKSVDEGIQAFLADSDNARTRAINLDDKIQTDARKISSAYSDLVSLATRQTLAGVETVVGPSNSIYMFMKDVGSSTRVSPVETLYAAFPTFLYLNPTWCQYLLEPLLSFQSSSRYTKSYAGPDLGSSYPNAEGQAQVNSLRSIDDTSAMLIMTWAHARFTGQQGLLNTYYSTLQKWADHLISSNALNPSGGAQTADGLDMNNMTNLAIKGIIGVRSMAEISHTLNKGGDASKYQDQASSWAKSWKAQAFSSGHLTSTYGASNTWALMYNLYADKLLGMKLVDDDVYDAQDTFYASQVSSSNRFGLPYDSNAVGSVKSHWTMLTAATTKANGVRDYLIQKVRDKATDGSTYAAFPASYNAQDGKAVSGRASPAQGAAYGLLTLNLQSKLAGLSGNSNDDSGSKSNAGAIAGGVVGGVAALALVILGVLFYRRRKADNQPRDYEENKGTIATFFSRGGNSGHRPGNPLDDYHHEPMTMPLPTGTSSGFHSQSQISYQSPTETYGGQPPRMSFSTSNGSTSNSGQPMLPLAPLRMHNGDNVDYQAPPLPRKGDLARIHATPSMEDIARRNAHNTALPTSPSVGGSTEASQLRNEVENLRREMEEMRSRTMYEPPPQYT